MTVFVVQVRCHDLTRVEAVLLSQTAADLTSGHHQSPLSTCHSWAGDVSVTDHLLFPINFTPCKQSEHPADNACLRWPIKGKNFTC